MSVISVILDNQAPAPFESFLSGNGDGAAQHHSGSFDACSLLVKVQKVAIGYAKM